MAVGLGLCMKNKLFLVALVLLQTLGCMKDSDKKIAYGPEVPLDLVVRSLKTAIGPTDSPEQILKEEFVYFETTRQIRGIPEISVLSQTAITVVDRKVTSNQWQINSVEEIQYYNLNDSTNIPPKIIREDHQCWEKSSNVFSECEIDVAVKNKQNKPSREYKESANDLTNTSRFFNFSFEDQIFPFKQMNTKHCVFGNPEDKTEECSYHNISSKTYRVEPPPAVNNSANCQNIPKCLIDVTILEFDEVNWKYDPEGYKIHYKFAISPDVPKLSRRLQVCKQGSVQIRIPDKPAEEAPRFLITFCDTVVDFIPGKL